MKKNVAIIILSITTILFLIYAFTQKLEADRQGSIATENERYCQMQIKSSEGHRAAAVEALRKCEESASKEGL
jgi:hypothetical protein